MKLQILVELLNEILALGGSPASLIDSIFCDGDTALAKSCTGLPDDVIVDRDDHYLHMTALGLINTALVREHGPNCDRLIAVIDDEKGLLRFDVGPYNHPTVAQEDPQPRTGGVMD